MLAIDGFFALLAHMSEGTSVASVDIVRKLDREAIGVSLYRLGMVMLGDPNQMEMGF